MRVDETLISNQLGIRPRRRQRELALRGANRPWSEGEAEVRAIWTSRPRVINMDQQRSRRQQVQVDEAEVTG